MSDIKFSCPQCGQHITCDELWINQQIACPSCQASLTVPQIAAAPAAAPAPASAPESLVPNVPGGVQPRLSINRTAHQPSHAGPPATPFTPGALRGYAPPQAEKKGKVQSIVTWTVLLAVLGVGIYFGFAWLLRVQAAANAKMAEAGKNSGGGEMGETASIYKTLDATDPDKMHIGSMPALSHLKRHESAANTAAAADDAEEKDAATPQPNASAPVVPATWTLDLNAAQIPVSRVNGMIGGAAFVAGTIRLDAAPTAQVLRFTQGDLMSPDREVLIYLHLTPGETPAGKTLTITTDIHGPTNPGIVERWKTTPQAALQTKSFTTGYALELQLSPIANGQISGKIYLSLPDPEKTVVAGMFSAATNLK